MGIEQIIELRRRLERETIRGHARAHGYELCEQCGHALALWRHVPRDRERSRLACNFVNSHTGARCLCEIDV